MILLDTHVVIWLAQDYLQISPKAHTAIEDARREELGLAVCGISLVEIARLASRGRIQLAPDAATVISEIERNFVVLPITGAIAWQAYEMPTNYPNDPADRIIGATALIEGLSLVTADAQIRNSRAIPTIW